MFKTTFRTFLCDEGVCEDSIGDEEKFREEFEGYVHWNMKNCSTFHSLMDANTYDVEYNGISNEINEAY